MIPESVTIQITKENYINPPVFKSGEIMKINGLGSPTWNLIMGIAKGDYGSNTLEMKKLNTSKFKPLRWLQLKILKSLLNN